MINGDLQQFLDTGWYMESTLYYKHYYFIPLKASLSTVFDAFFAFPLKCWRIFFEMSN